MENKSLANTGKSKFREYHVKVAAGETMPRQVYGDSFRVLSSTNNENVKVEFNDGVIHSIPPGVGFRFNDGIFTQVLLHNENGASEIEVEFAVALGEIYDTRFVLSDVISVLNISNQIDTDAAETVTNAAVTVITSDAAQKELLLCNSGSYTAYYGDATETVANLVANGQPIEPGDTYIANVNCACGLACATGETTTIRVTRHKST